MGPAGAPRAITKAVNPWGASWGDDDMIYYGQGPGGIWRVPAGGGTPQQILTLLQGDAVFAGYRVALTRAAEWATPILPARVTKAPHGHEWLNLVELWKVEPSARVWFVADPERMAAVVPR